MKYFYASEIFEKLCFDISFKSHFSQTLFDFFFLPPSHLHMGLCIGWMKLSIYIMLCSNDGRATHHTIKGGMSIHIFGVLNKTQSFLKDLGTIL